MAVDLFGRSIGNSPVVHPISAYSPMAFGKVTAPLRGLCRTTISLLPQPSSLRDDDAIAQLLAAGWPEPNWLIELPDRRWRKYLGLAGA